MNLFYYLTDDRNKEETFSDKWIKINIEKSPELKKEISQKSSYTELIILFNEKVKKISLIDLFCDDTEHHDLKILAKILKDMIDTNKLYVLISY